MPTPNRPSRCAWRWLAVPAGVFVLVLGLVVVARTFRAASMRRELQRALAQEALLLNRERVALESRRAAAPDAPPTPGNADVALTSASRDPSQAADDREGTAGPQDSRTFPPLRTAIGALGERLSPTQAGADLFRDGVIPELRIELSSEGMRALQRKSRDYVRATLREGTDIYTNVAIHLKGGPGSFRQVNDEPSFTVNFDKFAEGQTFHGLKKIHLNSSVQDPSFLSEKICRELFDAAGVPAPQAGHAVVTFNGRRRLYVLVEGVNKQFLKRYFKNVKGNVYDGHSGTDVTDNLPTNSGDDRRDHSGLRALAIATRQVGADARLAALEKTLDLDRFLTFLALEAMLWHWDGYTMNRNNFRIFHDRDEGRMVFLPHGLDQVLSEPQGPILPRTEGLVARTVLEIPEARARYIHRVAELSTNVFGMEAITNRIREVSLRIQAALGGIDPSEATAQQQRARSLSRRFEQRAKHLRRQFFPVKSTEFGSSGAVPLSDWTPRLDLGEADLTREEAEDGVPSLRIATRSGCTASWRTTLPLRQGRYRFEARLKTRGVVFPDNDSRAGAGLRVSRHRVGQKNAGDREWNPVTFDFEVSEDQSEIELICELRATQGEARFDLGSLQVKPR